MCRPEIEGIQLGWILNFLYASFLVMVSPWLLWRCVRAGKNKRGWGQKLLGRGLFRGSVARSNGQAESRCIWVHAVSVGEVNLLAPVLSRLNQSHPDLEIVISTTTETGFDLAQQKYPQLEVFFCPMDFTWAIKRVIRRLRPAMLVLAELELWPNLIAKTSAAGIPVVVINGRLSENSFRGYRRLKWLVRPTFKRLAKVAVQNQVYADRFIELGCERTNVEVTGSVKFDGVPTDRRNEHSVELAKAANVQNDEFVFVAGSTQIEEDLIAARVYQQLQAQISGLRLVLVPRHPERCDALVAQLNEMNMPWVRRSAMLTGKVWPVADLSAGNLADVIPAQPILVVDVIGELGGWWGVADVGYVGGSMGKRGGQNMIEPSAFGIPVSFGSNTVNFQQLVDELLVHDAAVVVRDQAELTTFVQRASKDSDWANEIGARAQNVVVSHVGASQRTVDCLSEVLRAVGVSPFGELELSHGQDGFSDTKAA
ncbi:MAG: 3-deoxy-D-manno-octulosonic-acid transferase [Mariniblastus sp.]